MRKNMLMQWLKRRRDRKQALILSVLAGETERSGFEIGKLTRIGTGSLYVHLQDMEQRGLLMSRWGQGTAVRGGRRSRLYRTPG